MNINDPYIQELAKMWIRQALQFAAGGLTLIGLTKPEISDGSLEVAAGIILAAITAAWMKYANSKKAMAENVVKFGEVRGIITERTPEGIKLASVVPESAVVPAGSAEARKLAA